MDGRESEIGVGDRATAQDRAPTIGEIRLRFREQAFDTLAALAVMALVDTKRLADQERAV